MLVTKNLGLNHSELSVPQFKPLKLNNKKNRQQITNNNKNKNPSGLLHSLFNDRYERESQRTIQMNHDHRYVHQNLLHQNDYV